MERLTQPDNISCVLGPALAERRWALVPRPSTLFLVRPHLQNMKSQRFQRWRKTLLLHTSNLYAADKLALTCSYV